MLIHAGVYSEVVILADGIGLYGGYDTDWDRDDNAETEHHTLISGGLNANPNQYITILARSIASTVQNLEVVGPDASGNENSRGRSGYAFYAADPTLVIESVLFTQGNGSAGLSGVSRRRRRRRRRVCWDLHTRLQQRA